MKRKKDKDKNNGLATDPALDMSKRIGKIQGNLIGIDIGSNQLKMVQMNKNGTIKRLAFGQIPEGLINQGEIVAHPPLVGVIKKTLKKSKIKGKGCAICLSNSNAIVREIKLPNMNQEQISNAIMDEITGFLSLEASEYIVDHKIVEEMFSEDGKLVGLRLKVVAIPKHIVHSYIEALNRANLKVQYVDIASNAQEKLIRISLDAKQELKNLNYMIIDFGASTTDIVILENGNYFVHKTIHSGGNNLTSVVAETGSNNIYLAEEDKFKTNYFLEPSSIVNTRVISYFDHILTDIERTIDFFKGRTNQSDIDKVYITGGASLLRGLGKYLTSQLGIDVSYLNEILNDVKGKNKPDMDLSFYTNAIGSTIREEA